MSKGRIVLEARKLTKRFPGVLANDRVDLLMHQGEILALLGENGAGKSTLMNMLYGLYRPDSGEIWIKGEQVTLHNPRDAINRGVGMVHQHFQLVPVMTVAENVMLGSEVIRNGRLDRREARRQVRELSQRYNLQVDPTAVVEDLPVGTQQRVEIIKALYRHADIFLFFLFAAKESAAIKISISITYYNMLYHVIIYKNIYSHYFTCQ
jgi:simple sugar transport system ATP-binding protein